MRTARLLISITLAGLALASPTLASAATTAAPAVATGPAKNVTYQSAELTGTVDPKGAETVYYFEYGTTASYGTKTPLTPAGNGTKAGPVTAQITGLAPLTKYHFRLVATSAGTTRGMDRTFTTAAVPLSFTLTTTPNPVVFGNFFYVEGTLTGTGSANHQVVLQANPFPFTAGFSNVGNPQVTNASGGFLFPFTGLTQNAQLRVATVGTAPVYSTVVTENVSVHVTLHVAHTRRHGYARLYGTVTPAEPGAQVAFQRFKSTSVLNVASGSVHQGSTTTSTFSKVVKVKRGVYRVSITVNDGAHASNQSSPVLIR